MKTPASNPLTKSPAGTWTIVTAKTIENIAYSGTVQVHPNRNIYIVSWLTTAGDYSGLAFFEDGHLLAACNPEESYGVSVYTINGDGTLDGKWTTPLNKGIVDNENAVGGTPDQLEGTYQVKGTITTRNASYEGTLNIRQENDIYKTIWSVGIDYRGVGLRVGNKLVVGWGEGTVFCLDYEIKDGRAQGRWANMNKSGLGVEIWQKIC